MTTNDKKKRYFFPLAAKIWAAFISLVIVCLGLVYLFTILFLENTYISNKQESVISYTEQAIEQVLSYDVFDTTAAQEDETLNAIAMENNLCITVLYGNGTPIAIYEGIGASCYVHSNMMHFYNLVWAAQSQPNKLFFTQVDDPQFFLCGRYFSNAEKGQQGDLQLAASRYIVIVAAPLASVAEAANAIRSQLIMMSVILILAATLVSLLLAFWLTRPMKKLSEAAKAVAEGNLDTVVQIASHDEIGACGDSFNAMVEQIKASNRMQREMIANVSHDLRTPLTMIRGYAESIEDIVGDDPAERNRQLDIIISETDRLSALVSDIMELSMMQAGKLRFTFEAFSIMQLMESTLSRFAFLEEKEGFTLELKASIPDTAVNADKKRIEQVLYNFINNAAAHSRSNLPDGTPFARHITLSLDAAEKSGAVRVSVIDQGEGIDEKEQPLIWDRYYKPYRTPGGVNRGTGLGLSIVKAILDGHHASYGVFSKPYRGSTFWFELPKAAVTNSDPAGEEIGRSAKKAE